MGERFAAGATILIRHVREGLVRFVQPVHVVEDRGHFLTFYMQPGSRYGTMGDAEGNRTRDFATASTHIELTWEDNHALHLLHEGDTHATVAFWDERWNFLCWYINFQEPFRRTSEGLETMDLTLDMLIAPDRQSWRFKDEDEFAYGIENGWYTAPQLASLKREGERIAAAAKRGDAPFTDHWQKWRPPVDWRPLALPADWRSYPGIR